MVLFGEANAVLHLATLCKGRSSGSPSCSRPGLPLAPCAPDRPARPPTCSCSEARSEPSRRRQKPLKPLMWGRTDLKGKPPLLSVTPLGLPPTAPRRAGQAAHMRQGCKGAGSMHARQQAGGGQGAPAKLTLQHWLLSTPALPSSQRRNLPASVPSPPPPAHPWLT